MDPDPLNAPVSSPDELKMAENSTNVFDPAETAKAVTSGNAAVNDDVDNTDGMCPEKPESNCSQVPHNFLSEKGENSAASAQSTNIVKPDSTDTAASIIEMNILGVSPPNDDAFPNGMTPECPLSTISTVASTAYGNPAISENQETLGDVSSWREAYDASASSEKACEEALPISEQTSLRIRVSNLSCSDRLVIISDKGNHPDGCRRQNEIPSSQEYGRVGDDIGGGQDREDMSMSHPGNSQQGSQVIPDEAGNLRILVRKTKPLLGIAIEGGANTRHPLPRIININENGAAYDAGGLQVGQLILEVDGQKVEGMHHQEVARLIAESFAQRDKPHIEFLVVEAKKSNLEPKPTALIFLEA